MAEARPRSCAEARSTHAKRTQASHRRLFTSLSSDPTQRLQPIIIMQREEVRGGALPGGSNNDDGDDGERRRLLGTIEGAPVPAAAAAGYYTSQPILPYLEQMVSSTQRFLLDNDWSMSPSFPFTFGLCLSFQQLSHLQGVHPNYKSQPYGISSMVPNNILGSSSHPMLTKSYSVSADGSISYLTPLQLGRHELYEMLPFAAVFGMQQKERNISKAYANYAADMETIEVDTLVFSQTQRHLSMAELDARKIHSSLLLMEELDLDAVVITTPLMIALFMAGMAQFLVGYNTSVMNSPSSVVFRGHTTFQWSLAVAVFAVGGPFGAVTAGTIIDSRGRRGGMAVVIYMFLFGGLIQTLARNMLYIIVARFIIGFASGFSSVLVPVYLGELAPPTLRGTLGTLTQFSLVTGIFVSDLLAFPFANDQSWRILFSVTVVVSIVQIMCFPFLIESPRWLLGRDRKSRKARHIIKKLRGLRYEHEIEIEVNHFVCASHAQSCDNNDDHTSSGIAFVAMLMDRQIRRLLICSLVLQMAQQLSGINAVFYYSTMFFEGVIDSPLMGTTIVGGVNVAATYFALRLMENANRRTLILWSAGGMFVSSVALMFCLLGYFNRLATLFFVLAYVTFFEVGLGPMSVNSMCTMLLFVSIGRNLTLPKLYITDPG